MNEMQSLAHQFVEVIVVFGRALHFPVMIAAIAAGIALRYVLYRTVRRQYWFSREFELRVTDFLHRENNEKSTNISFYVLSKKLLERSFYEVFANREKVRRGKFDTLVLADDRFFLTKFGCAWFVRELLKQVRFLQFSPTTPQLGQITQTVLSKNPAFNRVFGFIPASGLNDLLNILPGLFVIGGIFGTFLGVMHGLPELSGMDLNDPEKTKLIMDKFLADVALSMGASVTGIFLSVVMTLVNTAWSPERVHEEMIDRFENALNLLWNYATNNDVPSGLKPFNENADPIEALAEATVSQEYDRLRGKYDGPDFTPKSA